MSRGGNSNDKPINEDQYGRRDFLKISGLLLGYTGLSSLTVIEAFAASHAQDAPVPAKITHLTQSEQDILIHLIQAALPVEGTKLPSPEKASVLQTLDSALLARMEPHLLTELKGGIAFFNAGPKASYGGRHFTQLSLDEAQRFCDEWADADVVEKRGIVMGLKKLVGLAYWSNPITWPHLGYVGPISKRTNIPSLGNAPMPIV